VFRLNPTDTTYEDRLSEFDVPPPLSISGMWELPFGHGADGPARRRARRRVHRRLEHPGIGQSRVGGQSASTIATFTLRAI